MKVCYSYFIVMDAYFLFARASGSDIQSHNVKRWNPDLESISTSLNINKIEKKQFESRDLLSRDAREAHENKTDSKLKRGSGKRGASYYKGRKGGKEHLSGSSSSPVEPIKPLLNLGSSSSGGLTLPPHPVFDDAAPKNVTSLSENTAYLHCLVHNLGNKSVSWIRGRDLHILTVDRYTYTTDQRYEVIHSEGSKDWILKIKYAQVRDSDKYECQVSTKPVRTYTVVLNVYAPKAAIIGAPDMHVDKGSTINLTCVIEHSPEPPGYIFWYHNAKAINYDSPRGGIVAVTERGNNTTKGYLLIQDATSSDSGNYSCEPSSTEMTTVHVHVLDGEFPAAMQTSNAITPSLPAIYFALHLLSILGIISKHPNV